MIRLFSSVLIKNCVYTNNGTFGVCENGWKVGERFEMLGYRMLWTGAKLPITQSH